MKRITNQTFYEQPGPMPIKEIIGDPETYFSNSRQWELNALNLILLYYNRYHGNVTISQKRLADETGRSIRQVNRFIAKITELGIISKNYRHMRTNQYRIADFFLNLEMRKRLKYLFPALKFFALWMLTGCTDVLGYFNRPVNVNTWYLYNSYISSEREAKSEVMMTPGIKEAKKILNLSESGVAKLAIFPERALAHAVYCLKKNPDVEDGFRYLFAVCKKYCADRDLLVPGLTDFIYQNQDPVYEKKSVEQEKPDMVSSLSGIPVAQKPRSEKKHVPERGRSQMYPLYKVDPRFKEEKTQQDHDNDYEKIELSLYEKRKNVSSAMLWQFINPWEKLASAECKLAVAEKIKLLDQENNSIVSFKFDL